MSKKEEIKARFISEYKGVVEEFKNELLAGGESEEVYQGCRAPHIPIVGKEYYDFKYQMAFYGIETNGWGSLPAFLTKAETSAEEAILMEQSSLDNLECLGWVNNPHTTFWDFIFQFLSAFYNVPLQELMEGKHPEIIQSIVWGNTNAIESYEAGAEGEGVTREIYDKVKNASRRFDGAGRVINTLNPKVIIVLNWQEGEEWLTAYVDKTNIEMQVLNDHLLYYYLRPSDTHVFWTAHPGWLARQNRFDEQIHAIIDKVKELNIWKELPSE